MATDSSREVLTSQRTRYEIGMLAATAAVTLSWSEVDPVTGFGRDFMISVAKGNQGNQQVAYNPDADEYLAVWGDFGSAEWNIYGQVFSANGVPQGDNFMISAATGDQEYPFVAYNSVAHNYMVVWRDGRGVDDDVYGQIVNSDGSLSGAAFPVNTDTNDQQPNGLVYDPNADHFLVVLTDAFMERVEGQLLSPAGALLPPNAFVISGTGAANPDVAYNSHLFSYMVAYELAAEIYAQPVAADGSLPSGAVLVCCGDALNQATPTLAYNATSFQYLFAWLDDRNFATTGSDVFARRVNESGAGVGTGFALTIAADNQGQPAAAYNSRVNQWLVAWSDFRQTAVSDCDIFGQRVLADGSLAGQGNFAIFDGPGLQWQVALAARPTTTGAEFLAVWGDGRDGVSYKIAGQRIVALTGSLNWHDFYISAPLGSQENPDVAHNAVDDNFLVVWQDSRENEWDLYGQIVLTTGIPLNDNFIVRNEAHSLVEPAVAHSTVSNTYMVVWADEDEGDIEAQRLTAAGALTGSALNVEVITSTQPAIAYNAAANQYLVVYAREASPLVNDIYGRLVGADGAFAGAAFAISNEVHNQANPAVAYDATSGEYLVVWYDDRDLAGTGWNIYGQRVAANGTLSGGVISISTAAGDQYDPVVDWSGAADEYLVGWRDGRDFATTGYDIYAQRVSASGTPAGANVGVVTVAGNQTAPHINYLTSVARYNVLWSDDRNAGSWDIYAQSVNGDGTLYGREVAYFVFSGEQRRPAGDFSPQSDRGLVTWQDGRNDTTYKIYGRIKELRFTVYLPVTGCNW
jgi:hypothetical protein